MNKFTQFLVIALLALIAFGCNSEQASNPAEEKKLRDNMSKTKFDINDVPEKDREKVRGFMNANKAPSAGANAAPK